ncbi:type III secretion system export apparatus subunit SctT [Diaphorobacter nitroreducens]|uniref:type III secretion system export apparatus subunit SctT n=1 Tax=Diaphorobacter nitroreducens TaxID=164759 RepID=UPI0035B344B8
MNLTHQNVHDFLLALACAQPRTIALLAVLPMFHPQMVPGLLRLGVAAGVTLMVAPTLMPHVHADHPAAVLLVLLCKEAFVGFVLGFALAIPFWAFEAMGFLIDNQRGASIASTLNPLTGNDSSPLGILFNQAFIVFFLVAGGFTLVLGLLYDSFRLWPVFQWAPTLNPDTVPLMLAQLDRLMTLCMLYGAPVVLAMFLSELGLALVSRFVPQLQVFFLAMPIKSALALLVLVVYLSTLFELGRGAIGELADTVPWLHQQWSAPRAQR